MAARLLRVGLTGGLASGKSTVAAWLAEEGFRVVDADEIVADLYRPGRPGAEAVRRLFGDRMLDDDGAVDHDAVADHVFSDPEARRRLEAAIHPLVHKEFETRIAGTTGVAVLEGALLVEAGIAPHLDALISVEAETVVRLARAVDRGMPRMEAVRRLRAQGDGLARRAAATYVIENDGDLYALRAQVRDLIARLHRLAAA